MSYARITTRYDTDGNAIATEIEVGAPNDHPDLLDELSARATRIHMNVIGDGVEAEDDGER